VGGGEISVVREEDLADLLPLFRAYCAFYGSSPSDADLLALCRALLADPEREGVQLIARDVRAGGAAVGFATVYWTWQSTKARRLAVMNDLFVAEPARGAGVADALIAACAEQARERGVRALSWVTAPDNRRAQRVYDRAGATRSSWLEYELEVPGS
jgi:ribosomal protein S18 acetylase RimI-like enzyme